MGNLQAGIKRRNSQDQDDQNMFSENFSYFSASPSNQNSSPPKKKFIFQSSSSTNSDDAAFQDESHPLSDLFQNNSLENIDSLMTKLIRSQQKMSNLGNAAAPSHAHKNARTHTHSSSSHPNCNCNTSSTAAAGDGGGGVGGTLPTLFKWKGGGGGGGSGKSGASGVADSPPKEVFVCGDFNRWQSKIPMVQSAHNFYAIIDLPCGKYHYKFIVDGAWKVDPECPMSGGGVAGSRDVIPSSSTSSQIRGGDRDVSNVIEVKASDFHIYEALQHDMAQSISHTSSSPSAAGGGGAAPSGTGSCHANHHHCSNGHGNGAASSVSSSSVKTATSPAGGDSASSCFFGSRSISEEDGFSQEIPDIEHFMAPNNQPPLLPPQLLQVVVNQSVKSDNSMSAHPSHVMINHMYALCIRDGIIVLSAITRYRQKFVSTVIYKPF